jgi:hypothetical protein
LTEDEKLKLKGFPMTHKISMFANLTINHKSFLNPTKFRMVTVLNTDGNFAGATVNSIATKTIADVEIDFKGGLQRWLQQ